MTSIKVTNIPVQPLFLGFPGENDSRPVYVDVSPWLEEFPDATVSIVYTRSDGLTYAVVVNQTGPVVTWKPMEADLVGGKCSLQIQIKQGDAVKKDRVVDCVVWKSLDDPSDPPQDPRPTYVEEVIDAADRAEAAVTHYPQIRNDYWWVWDAESGKWVNTGVKATGEGGGNPNAVLYTPQSLTDSQKAQARTNIGAASMSDIPSLAAYRTASAQDAIDTAQDSAIAAKYTKPSGGIPDSDIASAAVWNTKGTYSKPASGIPASDLASGVQTSLGKADTALQSAPVTSVNNKTGAVTLGASDVHALPDSTAIPPTVTEQTVAGWGFTKNTGTYSKPSGGIPASDLASGVIPTVPQMATDPDMSDWTAGTTVDAAVLKNGVQYIERTIDALADDMGVMGDDLRGRLDTLENAGYQTASDVQTAINGVRQLPSVTATDNGKFLRVVNGAWAAETVSTWQGGSY